MWIAARVFFSLGQSEQLIRVLQLLFHSTLVKSVPNGKSESLETVPLYFRFLSRGSSCICLDVQKFILNLRTTWVPETAGSGVFE